MPGPIFNNIVLADEINRTPPKTQSALLEAMQEHRVTIQGRTYTLEEPFFVFATQNPIELEGTYPLPEAQLDRFMFNIIIHYMPEEEEIEVVRNTTTNQRSTSSRMSLPAKTSSRSRSSCVEYPSPIRSCATRLASPERRALAKRGRLISSRSGWSTAPVYARRSTSILGAKARALMKGRYHVSYEDIRALARPFFATAS